MNKTSPVWIKWVTKTKTQNSEVSMATIIQPYMFSWKNIEADSDLNRLRLVLSVLPDEGFVGLLEQHRGRGRDDYPIRPVWNALLAGIVFQHPSAAALLRELRRNGELRDVCGFDPLLGESAVPSDDAFGRFLALVMAHLGELLGIFDQLVETLRHRLPRLGDKLTVDSKAIRSWGRLVRDEEKRQQTDRRRDTDADWGTKTYKGMRADGTKWERTSRWFGYKLHLMVDATYELPLAFDVARASSSDMNNLMPLLEQLADKHPEVAQAAEELSADKGYDSMANNTEPFDAYGIKPVIDKRQLWQENQSDGRCSTRILFDDKVDSFVYDEQGHVFCVCPQTQEQREMFFCGFEAERQALKYRCPAAACGLECKGQKACEARASVGSFGRVIRSSPPSPATRPSGPRPTPDVRRSSESTPGSTACSASSSTPSGVGRR
jgi:hypothetical protein